MNSPKTYVTLLLAATTLGGAALAWRQYSELSELRAAAMNRDERADWQKRVWELEKLSRDLQNQLAAVRGVGSNPEELLAAADEERPVRTGEERGGPRGGRGGDPRQRGGDEMRQFTAMRELMSKPEVQAMVSVQQKAAIEARYAALFKNLNLAPDQVDKLKNLLAERGTTMADVASAAREQGINPRENPEAFRKLFTDAQNDINASIKSVLGDSGFAQLTQYEQTMPQRNLVNELQQRLSYTNTPLTAAQAEQMVQVLASNAPARTAGGASSGTAFAPGGDRGPDRGPGGFGGPGGPGGPGLFIRSDMGGMFAGAFGPGGGPMIGAVMDGGRGGAAPVTPAAVAQAQTVLAPPQLDALKQIQQQQQTQQQLQQLIRETMAANQPAPGDPNRKTETPSGPAGPGGPKRRPGGGG